MDKIKVYFLGSGEFAVPFLKALLESPDILLVGIGTQPDKPSGRKRVLTPTPVGVFADGEKLCCERIVSASSEDFHRRLLLLNPDILVVVSFGQLLREHILNLPNLGCLNVHGSILPRYRGASPLTASILSGDPETGVTFMRMDKGLDTGPVYTVKKMAMSGDITTQSLETQLSEYSASSLPEIIQKIKTGLRPVPQDHLKATLTKKIHKTDGSIHWDDPAAVVERKIRAYYPWPGSTFRMVGKSGLSTVKITKARVVNGWYGVAGTTLVSGKRWIVACGEEALEILRVIPEGSREMSSSDYMRGLGNPGLVAKLLDGPRPKTV